MALSPLGGDQRHTIAEAEHRVLRVEVGGRARLAGSVAVGGRVGAYRGHPLLGRVRRHSCVHGQEQRHGRHAGHRREIAQHVVRHRLQAGLDQHIGLVKQQGLAVRTGLGDHIAGGGAGSARPVVHLHRHAEPGPQALGEHPRHGIGHGAGRKGCDQTDRPRRIAHLPRHRGGLCRRGGQGETGEADRQQTAGWERADTAKDSDEQQLRPTSPKPRKHAYFGHQFLPGAVVLRPRMGRVERVSEAVFMVMEEHCTDRSRGGTEHVNHSRENPEARGGGRSAAAGATPFSSRNTPRSIVDRAASRGHCIGNIGQPARALLSL